MTGVCNTDGDVTTAEAAYMTRIRTLILGAAGRDFHNFNMVYRNDAGHEIVAFTAQQIPGIADRRYPAELAGPLYPEGIPIRPESRLESVIREFNVELCVLSYSDLSYDVVGHLASRCNAAGADFTLLNARGTMLESRLPVVAVCASRTGAGKSQTSRAVADVLHKAGLRVSVLRHPMPYGDLAAQRVQRFAGEADLRRHEVTVEEREEYEPHIANGSVVWAGVDYEAILREAELEADVVLWDGGNNDTSFIEPMLYITVVDPHRPGHELSYYPGETNVRLADVVIINKVDSADRAAVEQVRANVRSANPDALILEAASPLTVDDEEVLRGRTVLAIEDGPTLTHGGMTFGAASLAAKNVGATLANARAFAIGEIADTFAAYPHVGHALPAMGYGDQQLEDLSATIVAGVSMGVEAVAIGTPIDLGRLVNIPVPSTRVRYSLKLLGDTTMETLLAPTIRAARELKPESVLAPVG
jgi:predicted GTPase